MVSVGSGRGVRNKNTRTLERVLRASSAGGVACARLCAVASRTESVQSVCLQSKHRQPTVWRVRGVCSSTPGTIDRAVTSPAKGPMTAVCHFSPLHRPSPPKQAYIYFSSSSPVTRALYTDSLRRTDFVVVVVVSQDGLARIRSKLSSLYSDCDLAR